MNKQATISKKELDELKNKTDSLPDGKEKLKALVEYHDQASEYWDSKVGKTQDDDKCTRNYEKHQKLLDENYNKLKELEKQSNINNRIIKRMAKT